MPKYRVQLHGCNFLVSISGKIDAKHGFHTNRFVEAPDEKTAELAAVDQLRNCKSPRDIIRNSPDDPPRIELEQITELVSFDGLPSLDQGLVWYPETPADPAVQHYTTKRIPNPDPSGKVSWQRYHTVRNAIVRGCRRFGPTGPMGERPITDAVKPALRDWPVGDPKPIDFFVVDDQYNHERYIYVEIVRPGAFTGGWLREMVATMAHFPGWGVGIMAFKQGYILAFADRLMVTGEIFSGCADFDGVVRCGFKTLSIESSPPGIA